MSDNNEYTHCLPTGTRIKDYEIEGVLGKGGFGITYLARDVNLHKKVAIKELLPDGIATRGNGMSVIAQSSSQQGDFRWAVDSFLKEAQILAGFDHPNIVHVYRLFEEHQTAYMVMPFIEGVSLKQVVKAQKTLPFEDVDKILTLLMEGLEVVHNADTLHRDIKPDNIIINKKGIPMLIDFGAARQQVSGKTQDVTSIITPGYAPVEQYSTDARYQGPWSDIYALAACTYFMITGKQPTPASERSDAVRNQQPDPLPKLVDLAPKDFPRPFLAAMDSALQMAESMRPQSISDWKKQITGVTAAPSGPPPMPPGQGPEPGSAGGNQGNESEAHSGPHSGSGDIISDPPQPRKKKKTALVATICAVILALVGAGSFVAWKSFSGNDPSSDSGVISKLDKAEAYLEVNKPRKAQSTLTTIELESVPTDQKDRFKKLSKDIQKLIEEGSSTLAVSFEPVWAQTYIDGKKCGVTSGKIKVTGLGNHTLRISADGFQSRSISFEAKEIGGTVSLSKVVLTPSTSTSTIAQLIDDLENAVDNKDHDTVTSYYDRLSKANIPIHLQKRAKDILEKARKFKNDNKWIVSLKVNPPTARVYLNGTSVTLKNGKFKGTRSGSQLLKLTAEGYDDKTHSFTLNADGRHLDLGTISLTKKKATTDTVNITKETALAHAKSYLVQHNSKYADDSQYKHLASAVFWEDDQEKQKPLADIKKEVGALFKRWGTRTYTLDHNSTNVKLHKTGRSWVVSITYDFEWKDNIFTLKGRREGLFIVMGLSGKTSIVAQLTKVIGKDERKFNSTTLRSTLEAFNKKRLSAGDSEGGESVAGEASYYSNNTEYYGPRFLNRNQIMQEIRESRAKSGIRIFTPKSYSDYTNMNIEDPSNRTFRFKCVTEVHKNTGKSTRTEIVKVRFENGKPIVISVRY